MQPRRGGERVADGASCVCDEARCNLLPLVVRPGVRRLRRRGLLLRLLLLLLLLREGERQRVFGTESQLDRAKQKVCVTKGQSNLLGLGGLQPPLLLCSSKSFKRRSSVNFLAWVGPCSRRFKHPLPSALVLWHFRAWLGLTGGGEKGETTETNQEQIKQTYHARNARLQQTQKSNHASAIKTQKSVALRVPDRLARENKTVHLQHIWQHTEQTSNKHISRSQPTKLPTNTGKQIIPPQRQKKGGALRVPGRFAREKKHPTRLATYMATHSSNIFQVFFLLTLFCSSLSQISRLSRGRFEMARDAAILALKSGFSRRVFRTLLRGSKESKAVGSDFSLQLCCQHCWQHMWELFELFIANFLLVRARGGSAGELPLFGIFFPVWGVLMEKTAPQTIGVLPNVLATFFHHAGHSHGCSWPAVWVRSRTVFDVGF
jgi:hypothetical protein